MQQATTMVNKINERRGSTKVSKLLKTAVASTPGSAPAPSRLEARLAFLNSIQVVEKRLVGPVFFACGLPIYLN
jgi:hypothetical protein